MDTSKRLFIDTSWKVLVYNIYIYIYSPKRGSPGSPVIGEVKQHFKQRIIYDLFEHCKWCGNSITVELNPEHLANKHLTQRARNNLDLQILAIKCAKLTLYTSPGSQSAMHRCLGVNSFSSRASSKKNHEFGSMALSPQDI